MNSLQRPMMCATSTRGNTPLFPASFRCAMLVTEVMVFPNGYAYYVCPRCSVTMVREFMSYCDRCGQHLNWKGYKKAKVIYPGSRKEVHI